MPNRTRGFFLLVVAAHIIFIPVIRGHPVSVVGSGYPKIKNGASPPEGTSANVVNLHFLVHLHTHRARHDSRSTSDAHTWYDSPFSSGWAVDPWPLWYALEFQCSSAENDGSTLTWKPVSTKGLGPIGTILIGSRAFFRFLFKIFSISCTNRRSEVVLIRYSWKLLGWLLDQFNQTGSSERG